MDDTGFTLRFESPADQLVEDTKAAEVPKETDDKYATCDVVDVVDVVEDTYETCDADLKILSKLLIFCLDGFGPCPTE